MEAKKFEEFYSLCEREVRQQRLLGAGASDVAFLLKGMLAVHPEEEYTPEQEKKFWDLVVGKDKSRDET